MTEQQNFEETTDPANDWVIIDPSKIAPLHEAVLSRQRAKLWALTLDSRSIPCQLLNHADDWFLLVPPEQVKSAFAELQQFENNNQDWPPQLPITPLLSVSVLATVSVLLALAAFYNITSLSPDTISGAPLWREIGNADATRITGGELWRTVTALTLHADAGHLLGNCAIGGIFAFWLCRQIGSGLGWFLILLSGVFGNFANGLMQPAGHLSIGGSTAVFGAVGVLGAIGQLRYRNYLRRRWLLPVAGALTLLTILGSEGKNTDLGAHFFGLLAGIVLGFIVENIVSKHGVPGKVLNALLAILTLTIVAGAWCWGIYAF